MDPLTITAGVLGILKASGELVGSLYQLGTKIKDARSDADAVAKEVSNITIVVQGLQGYVFGRSKASPQRLELITLEQIVATLTECVLTYSELDETLKSVRVGSGMNVWDRAMWLLKKEKVATLTLRLQNHKATFSMMLNILQSASMSEAERTMEELCRTVNEVLRTNEELSMRLRNIEGLNRLSSTASSVRHSRAATTRSLVTTKDDSEDPEGSAADERNTATLQELDSESAETAVDQQGSSFEELLHRSRVYRHAADNESLFSRDDARSTLALSICSSLTLGEISNISVFALPVYLSELSNPENFCSRDEEPVRQGTQQLSQNERPSVTESGRRRDRASWWKELRHSPKAGKTLTKAPPQSHQHIFGVPFSVSIQYANVAISMIDDQGNKSVYGYVPIVVAKCGVYLKREGTEVENIFELTGSLTRVRQLQNILDTPPRFGKDLAWTGCTVHDAANVFLRYLIQLPESIIPMILYDRFQAPFLSLAQQQDSISGDALVNIDRSTAVRTYKSLIADMATLNRQLLLYVLDILAVFASKSSINKMTTLKLAALFQPGILNRATETQHAVDTHADQLPNFRRTSQIVVAFLIANHEQLLMDGPATQVGEGGPSSDATTQASASVSQDTTLTSVEPVSEP